MLEKEIKSILNIYKELNGRVSSSENQINNIYSNLIKFGPIPFNYFSQFDKYELEIYENPISNTKELEKFIKKGKYPIGIYNYVKGSSNDSFHGNPIFLNSISGIKIDDFFK